MITNKYLILPLLNPVSVNIKIKNKILLKYIPIYTLNIKRCHFFLNKKNLNIYQIHKCIVVQ